MMLYTTKGYKVAVDRITKPIGDDIPRHNHTVYGGRIAVVPGNPFHDQYADWWLDGRAIEHEYGNLLIEKTA